ncbi:peptide-methionine (R)-S-oxide reductase MsrB [Phaeobacter piscinae]|uniref:peptide-methionine (R)-S-oxide reductase MsrB n=1 Tax=Phaeobacter piscinae TaxID=1580596 RepID=UPI000BBE60FB|nr:peptide-methionine (R)-S-oxide reductase MsrB [Phaeobacter piscinae]ATG41849.1 peptide methionine sulfoxide reductase MsrB [Phaeobacter piscinae]ATG41943.1 peptide methionine sulfoxide reductase MsrB [Phaeobacter piscinae]ATG41964.1 peptide methionine sulfoxide reductase MsrB [Phaeobacter piscinae]
MKRRDFIALTSSSIALATMGHATTGDFEITRTEAEWRAMLTEAEYLVMREEKTERKFASPLNNEKRDGVYHCRGCDLALYSSDTKYDSGTGWPSFWDVLPNAIGTKMDNTFFTTRTECHCRRCGSHLGHIFNDGPQPTGKRHCLNGLSLVFQAV